MKLSDFGPAALKAYGGVVMTVAMFLASALTDNHITSAEWVNTGLVFLGTVGVWYFPNTSGGAMAGRIAKFVAMVLTGVLGQLLVVWVPDGMISGAEWAQLIVAVLGSIGIVAVPNVGYVWASPRPSFTTPPVS